MMKILRVVVAILFVIMTVLSGLVFIVKTLETDTTIPKITVEGNIIEVSLKPTREELLQGVTAYDEKDKDLTNSIIIESISKFISPGVCKVTYSVCDKDNNVASASRKIHYKDYVSPRFKLNRSLCYSLYETPNMTEAISAYDCLEGDITQNMILTSDDYTSAVSGVFTVKATVTSNKGDVSEIHLPLIIEDRSSAAPEIILKDYLIYVKPNTRLDLRSFLVSAQDLAGNNLTAQVKVESNINTSKEGMYLVHYFATDEAGNRGHSVLTVVVGI